MYQSKIRELKQKFAETSAAFQNASKRGDIEPAEKARTEMAAALTEMRALEAKQKDHDEAEEMAKLALEPAGKLNIAHQEPKSSSPEAAVARLAKIDREIVFSALNLGVDRAAQKFEITDATEKAALAHATRVHSQAFRAYIGSPKQRQGEAEATKLMAGLPEHVRLAMWTVEGEKGGFLAPPTYRAQPIENRTKPGLFRKLARVEATSGDLMIPVIKQPASNADYQITDFTGAWVKEGNRQSNEQVLGLDQLRITPFEWQGHWIAITDKLMRNATANVADIVSRVINSAANLAEEVAFWTGNGVDRPEGLLRLGNAITPVNSGDANLLTYRGLRRLHYTLRAPYRENATYAMASMTYGDSVLGLESTGGTYVFLPGLEPGTLFGRPIEFCELLDSVAADNHPIVFGDFNEAYTIAEESTLRIIRSDEKFIPQVGFMPTFEVGGRTTQEAAVVKQKVAA